MDEKRIAGIKARVGGMGLLGLGYIREYSDLEFLLDALEEAQLENARLREALEEAQQGSLDIVMHQDGHMMTLCYICLHDVKDEGHADNCPFKVLERGNQ